MWLHEDWRSVFYFGRICLDNVPTSSFADWVRRVSDLSYHARHEYQKVGTLPARVMAFPSVVALNPSSDAISISDAQIRHSIRPNKTGRGASLSIADLENLPNKLKTARWFFDYKKKNLLAVISVTDQGKVGKAAIHVNFGRGGTNYNAIVTTGLILPSNLNDLNCTEIL